MPFKICLKFQTSRSINGLFLILSLSKNTVALAITVWMLIQAHLSDRNKELYYTVLVVKHRACACVKHAVTKPVPHSLLYGKRWMSEISSVKAGGQIVSKGWSYHLHYYNVQNGTIEWIFKFFLAVFLSNLRVFCCMNGSLKLEKISERKYSVKYWP